MLDIHSIMQGLAERGPIINSRVEFHDALCDYLCGIFEHDEVIAEIHPRSFGNTKFIIGIPRHGVAIRLWCPRAEGWRDNQTRYEFLRDVDRMERAVADGDCLRHGLVVMLTDMNKLWEIPKTSQLVTSDAAFLIHHGATLSGMLDWATQTKPGTKKGREKPIQLDGRYLMYWRNYHLGSGKNSKFRYLAVEVGN